MLGRGGKINVVTCVINGIAYEWYWPKCGWKRWGQNACTI